LNQNRDFNLLFCAVSSREPVSTSLENAIVLRFKSPQTNVLPDGADFGIMTPGLPEIISHWSVAKNSRRYRIPWWPIIRCRHRPQPAG
jgi:hypothetical protein